MLSVTIKHESLMSYLKNIMIIDDVLSLTDPLLVTVLQYVKMAKLIDMIKSIPEVRTVFKKYAKPLPITFQEQYQRSVKKRILIMNIDKH